MATLPDALPKSLADTLYAPKSADLTAATLATPTEPTWNDTNKTFTIPAITGVDYYEWRGIYGFAEVTGTITRATSDDTAYPRVTRIQARPQAGYALKGATTYLHTYPA